MPGQKTEFHEPFSLLTNFNTRRILLSQAKNPADSSNPEELPTKLREDLAAAIRSQFDVPSELDAAILKRAREQLGTPRSRVFPIKRVAAAAAVLFIGAYLLRQSWTGSNSTEHENIQALREDFDRSGRVDILDAYLLAKTIELQESVPADWDISGDGLVNQEDVDSVAGLSVLLQ